MTYEINLNYPAKNFDKRIRFLVLHYTAKNFEDSLEILTQEAFGVSGHYLIPESSIDGKKQIFQLVPEKHRAWHAGVSAWQGRIHLNDTSIGIEIVNLGYQEEGEKRRWFPFLDYQIELIIELAKDIIERYQLHPTCVVGHSDISPERKADPGPLFPWKKLYEQGIGAWYEDECKKEMERRLSNETTDIRWLQRHLKTYGYSIEETGELDKKTQQVVCAFQMHFRPTDYSGIPDKETYAILYALVKKYFPEKVSSPLS
ncbi:N-acetylmuramoyl-L-alanine amidase [Coxiella burnetii]|uniref:N-acetylmuramoyl-L-alanine amidase n=2 Tax=Coxiella burnetii TaxID=777 RepID=Q83EE5_COXBU|nr:N-acetylmuramoyl-L-alanine amidase [Coxiella burnetii]NP_819418.1 anhydro-N-acetylmuramyl-tripeptide amidase [Coxiella burnetii RSA 493]AAO89932.1 anhydro-N-acetylmuramyl-tripeptide amidase [Coxiella burnetii RSA 493]ABS78115.1 anhydro-N-acetylmuramyl-tripeptide amidase [Coxiella burnetii Dugway 5J108-111]ABX77552.1 N-acetylmuramoyl-L-alanine amidase/peptidoglycan binding domain protein [Coxiella burnetii RSA 331]AML48702.1 nucleoside transporter [Coxiella burnetii]AML54674.1 nucleoside tr